ncbi:hypothetical protein GOBAR_DD15209 [Gossypium barbadense]|nr:hypothetical protein GOBAR_DD15209 [Gossypium barbadense]
MAKLVASWVLKKQRLVSTTLLVIIVFERDCQTQTHPLGEVIPSNKEDVICKEIKQHAKVMPTPTTKPSPFSSSLPVMMLAMDVTMLSEAIRTIIDTFLAIPISGVIIMPIHQTSHLVVSLLIANASKLGQSEGAM